MKKYFFGFAVFFLLFFSPTAFSEDITYCSNLQNYNCVYETTSFKDFLDNLGETYFETLNFETFDNYIYLEDSYFKFYIPNYVMEYQLVDEFGDYVGVSDWEDIDINKNKVHDNVDDLIESFQKIEKKYFGSDSFYNFKKWENKISVLIDYSCYYSLNENSCVYGYYAPNDEYAASFDITGNYIMIDPEGILPGPLNLSRTESDTESTIAHEVFHVVQNAYISDSFFWNNYAFDNFFEGTAVSMQRNSVGSSYEYLNYLTGSQFQYPSYSIFGPTPSAELANYGSFIWYNFLERKYGKDIINKLLDAYSDLEQYPPVYRSFIANFNAIQEEGSTIYEAYLEYVKWNYDKEKYTYSDSLRDIYITKSHDYYPTGPVGIESEDAPTLFASNYIEFDLRSRDENLRVSFNANNDADMYVSFLPVGDDNPDYDKSVEYIVEKGNTTFFTVPGYGFEKVIMIVSVLDISDDASQTDNVFFDYVYPYSYEAEQIEATAKLDLNSGIPENLDLTDYFLFFPQRIYDLKISDTDKEGNKEVDYASFETKECNNQENCVIYASDSGFENRYIYFGDEIFINSLFGESISQIKYFSKEIFTEILKEEAYSFIGIRESDSFTQISYSCTLEYLDTYHYLNLTDSALKRICNYTLLDKMGASTEIKQISYFLKNVGEVLSNSDYYYNNEYLGNQKIELIDTNFIKFDFANEDDDKNGLIFSDLTEDHKNYDAVVYLTNIGVINGYNDGTFKPENFVNRAELLKILIEGLDITPDIEVYSHCFPDVKSDWYTSYVCYAKEKGWVEGYPDGEFKPSKTVNKVEAIKMLLNSQQIDIPEDLSPTFYEDVKEDDWFAGYISKAREMGVLEETGQRLYPTEDMKRGSICENLSRLLLYLNK